MSTRSRTIRCVSLCMAMALLSGCGGHGAATRAGNKAANMPGPAEIRSTVKEGYVYGLPIVMNYAIMHGFCIDKQSGEYKGPFNKIVNEARVFTPKDAAVVAPNNDTPSSMLWLDLRAEPQVLSVPAVEKGRYYSVMFCDGNTFNYGYIGTRATGNEAGDYLVAGPGFKDEPLAGVKKVFRSSTQFSAVIYRTQLFSPEDLPNVVKVQSGYKVQPLSAYRHRPAPPPAPALDFPKINPSTFKDRFFDYLEIALKFARPGQRRRTSAPSWPASASARARSSTSGSSPSNTGPKSWPAWRRAKRKSRRRSQTW